MEGSPPVSPPNVRKSSDSSSPLLLDKCRTKYSWALGVTRGTDEARRSHKRGLQKAFEEIDGLMAGFQYLDDVDPEPPGVTLPPSPRSSRPMHPWTTQPDDIQFQGEKFDPSYHTAILEEHLYDGHREGLPTPATTPVREPQPMPSQWAAIRSLRGEIEFHHKRFLELTAKSDNATLHGLRATFPSPKSIRKSGTIMYRDILNGFKPCLLEDIFAFASLSYAMSQQLSKRGRIKHEDILEGLRVWRDAISDSTQKEAFSILAEALWPEARNHLHFIPLSPATVAKSVAQSTVAGMHAQLPDIFGAEHSINSSLAELIYSTLPAHSALQPHIASLDYIPSLAFDYDTPRDNAIDLANDYRDQFGLFDLIHTDSITNQPMAAGHSLRPCQTDPISWDPGPSAQEAPTATNHDATREAERAAQLRQTGVFLIVFAFVLETRELLRILSGRGLISRPLQRYEAEREKQKRFYESARVTFFKPRCLPEACPSQWFTAVLSVANDFAELGYLRSIEEVRYFLVTVAPVSPRPWSAAGDTTNTQARPSFSPANSLIGSSYG